MSGGGALVCVQRASKDCRMYANLLSKHTQINNNEQNAAEPALPNEAGVSISFAFIHDLQVCLKETSKGAAP